MDNLFFKDLTKEEQVVYGFEQGLSLGKEEATLNMINKMIELNMNVNDISKITDIPVEQIESDL